MKPMLQVLVVLWVHFVPRSISFSVDFYFTVKRLSRFPTPRKFWCDADDDIPLVNPILNSKQFQFESQPELSVQTKELVFYLLPFFVPLLGFVLYDPLAHMTRDVVIALGHNGWAFSDGGQYKAEILAPTINGIVVPTISIALATLVAGTISSLRERQGIIRSCLNNEAAELKTLHVKLLQLCRESERVNCISLISLLGIYIMRVLKESSSNSDVRKLSTITSELHSIIRYLYAMNGELDNNEIGSLEMVLSKLNSLRAMRITALQNVFPIIHWAVITLLGTSILLCFMLETDQDTLKFLDGTQLRILFTFLMGAVSSTALLCFDLSQPFRYEYGFFTVPPACVQQLVVIGNEIKMDIKRFTDLLVQDSVINSNGS